MVPTVIKTEQRELKEMHPSSSSLSLEVIHIMSTHGPWPELITWAQLKLQERGCWEMQGSTQDTGGVLAQLQLFLRNFYHTCHSTVIYKLL